MTGQGVGGDRSKSSSDVFFIFLPFYVTFGCPSQSIPILSVVDVLFMLVLWLTPPDIFDWWCCLSEPRSAGFCPDRKPRVARGWP